MKYYLGIDFGAANIMVAIADEDDTIRRLHFENEEALTGSKKKPWLPNWYAKDQQGKEYFGWDAKNLHEELARNEETSDTDFFFNYKIHLHEFNQNKEEVQGKRARHAMEKMLAFIKTCVDQHLRELNKDHELVRLVITVPVGWAEAKTREVYLEIIERVFPGITVRLVAEPVAASIPLLELIHTDGKERNCLIVDIGASTLDVSLVKDTGVPPLEVEKGAYNTFAGNYCDEKIAEWLQREKVASRNDALHKAIELKEGGRKAKALNSVFGGWAMRKAENIFNFIGTVKQSWSDKKAKKLAQDMAEKAVQTIEKTLNELQDNVTGIDYLIFCGGMSKFEWGYIDTIVESLKKKHPPLLEHCTIDRELPDVDRFSDEMRDMAIAKGAARLAKNPDLVVEKLGYDVGAVLTLEGKAYYPSVIDADVKLLNEKQEFSFYESILRFKNKIPELNNNGFTLRPKDTESIPIWFCKPGEKKHTFNARMNSSWAQTKLEGDEEIVVLPDSSYDVCFVLDEHGIIQMNLVDLQSNTTVGTAHYDVNSPHELSIG